MPLSFPAACRSEVTFVEKPQLKNNQFKNYKH